LKEVEPALIDYINRSRKLSFDIIPKESSKLIQYYLTLLVKELDNDVILSIIYGRFFKLVSNYKLGGVNNKLAGITSNTSVDIFVDLANDLIQNYFFLLYKKYNSSNSLVSYTLSD